jgi:hypothetical protein
MIDIVEPSGDDAALGIARGTLQLAEEASCTAMPGWIESK